MSASDRHRVPQPTDFTPPPHLRERFRAARRVFVLSGAGISAESGIPTFRGAGGLWKHWNPADYASPEAFARDPERVWRWYLDRRTQILAAEPNPGHRALAELERRVSAMMIATQNIDGLHQRGGSRRVVEIHGSIHKCRPLHAETELPIDAIDPEGPLPPLDPATGQPLRPAVVWFGEQLPLGPIEEIEEFLHETPDLTLVVGTTSAFPYIMEWALRPQAHGGMMVLVNLEPNELSLEADAVWHTPAGVALPQLIPWIGPGQS